MIPEELQPFTVPVDELSLLAGNPRRGNVEAIKKSLGKFGQRSPLLYRTDDDGSKVVYVGNHRLMAARELGWETVAAVSVDDLTIEEVKAFSVADNKTGDMAEYDEEELAAMLLEISHGDDQDLLEATSFTQDDLDALLADGDGGGFPDLDGAPGLDDELIYKVIVECDSEEHQAELVNRLEEEGLNVKASIL